MASQSSPPRPHADRLSLIKREYSPPLPRASSEGPSLARPLVTGPNSLRLPVINVVPPTPESSFDPYGSFFSPESSQFARWLTREIAEEEQAVSSMLFPRPTSIAEPDLPKHFVPLKHCYTDHNRHLWQQDYANWCAKAQKYFDKYHPRANITLPAQRPFGGTQRGPLEKYMLEVDALPLHPASVPFSTNVWNGLSQKRDFVCFRCGQLKRGDKLAHDPECEYSLPFEQTVYYFTWESLRKSDKEALLMRIPRVWQEPADMDMDQGHREIAELRQINEEQGAMCRKLFDKAEAQGKRLEDVEEEIRRVKAELKYLKNKVKTLKLAKESSPDMGKENRESSRHGNQWHGQKAGHELLPDERSRVKRTRLR